jgi:predicted outer membrane repeat protein
MVNKSNLRSYLGISIFLLVVAGSAQAATITVGLGINNGYDFIDIQAGIDAAVDGDMVLVAPGEYVITVPITFRGKAITAKSEAGLDGTTIRMDTPTDTNRGSVVVFENNETDASVLDGFTITGGMGCRLLFTKVGEAPRFWWQGGGILFNASSGTVRNCAIAQNRAEAGGAVMVVSGSSAILKNCFINENSATDIDGAGGGLCCADDSSVTMTKCVIRNNSTSGAGGGVVSYDNSSMTMTNCEITHNTAEKFGGGIYVKNASMTLKNCIIARNTGGWGGGGVGTSGGSYYGSPSFIEIANCTIMSNSGAVDAGGGGILSYGAGSLGAGSITVTNSIVCGNTSAKGPEVSLMSGEKISISFSNVAGGQNRVNVEGGSTLDWGPGNIDADPLFAEPGYWADINDPNIIVEQDDPNAIWIDGDYHLKSEAGRWNPISVSWIMDDVTSPCIDRGDSNSPVDDEPDPNGGMINMGAYGGTPEASMSIGQLPPILLALWRLDGTEGDIAYEIVGNNNGILKGNPTWQPVGGKLSGALQFDGIDDYVSTPFILNPGKGSFSVFAWIRGGAPGQVIISQSNTSGGRGILPGCTWLGIDPSEGKLMTGLMDTFFGPLESDSVISDGQWHHICLVYDRVLMKRQLYVDGIEVAVDKV